MNVAVVGTGLIGTGWAALFASRGLRVVLYDIQPGAATHSKVRAAEIVEEIVGPREAKDAVERIIAVETLAEAVREADYVQESVAEDLASKRDVYSGLQSLLRDDAIVGSSTSAIPPAELYDGLPGAERYLIVHPFNPPYLIPLVEVVSSARTSPEVQERTRALLLEWGMSPVDIKNPLPGFAVNRLQVALVNEAMNLVREGVVEPADVDRCIKDGLGLRWAFLGPFETMHLNAPAGFEEYVSKFGCVYQALGQDLGVDRPWQSHDIERVSDALSASMPVGDIGIYRAWRDNCVRGLLALKSKSRKPTEGA